MKVIVLSSYAPTLFFFREEMMKEMINSGHEVVAVAPEKESEWKDRFNKIGVKYISIPNVERTGTNPIKDILGLFSIYKVLKRERPNKIFTYQAKTIIYGAIAAKLLGIKEVYAMMGGLGSVFRNNKKISVTRGIMEIQYKIAFKFCKKVFFQNNDDCNLMLQGKIVHQNQIQMINGSGVNLNKFKRKNMSQFPVFLFVGRIIKDKGILEYIEAAKKVKHKYPNARVQIVGYFDTNPTAIQKEDIQKYIDDGTIEYLGETDDVRPFLEKCSVFVLPSYHEGTPKSVLEAMATGRPIITTDAPGCRETVIDGVNGFLVPVKNSNMLAEKMIWMIENKDKSIKMGEKSYEICKKKFDVNLVNEVILKTMNL